MIKQAIQVLVWLLCCCCSAVVAAQRIDSVRMSHSADSTRLVFDLQGSVQHTVFKLTNPDRIVVDIPDVTVDFDFSRFDLGSTPINTIRVGKSDNIVRVVLDLKKAQRPKTVLLPPGDGSGWRLVVDLFDDLDPEAPPVRATAPARPAATAAPLGQTPASDRKMVIAIDPGHGGQDPGAIGRNGTREKDVVLQIAMRLAEHINREKGMRAVLVRTGDYYVPLAERRRIASETHKADVFLSIHADAFTDPRAHGASVFALSNRGATSARASELARMANDSDRVAGVYQPERENSTLLNVLADMVTDGSMRQSLVMGRMLLEELGQVTKLHGGRTKVEQAGFVVLKDPSMMSLLVETGFISNAAEEKNLRSSAHQEKLARAIVRGLHRYFEMHPHPNTFYAALRQNGSPRPATHQIASGETLSSIARRYSVSEAELRRHNNLRGDTIRAGQILKIPPG